MAQSPIDPDLALAAVRSQLAVAPRRPFVATEPVDIDLNGMDNLLADLMVLHLGFESYAGWLNASGQKITETHAKKAVTVLRRYEDQLDKMMEGPLKAIVERSDARQLQPSWRKATQGAALSRIRFRAKFFNRLLMWMSSRRAAANDLITSGKARQQIVRLYSTVDEESPLAVITQLAGLPSVSGGQQLREWTREAAKRMGVEITGTEETIADAQTATAMADQISQLDKKLASSDSMSEESASLSVEKGEVIAQLDSFVANTSDPSSVRSAAVSAASRPASKVAQDLDLDPEKVEFLLQRGKVLLAAGAGSGKCIDKDTLVQTERGLVAIGSILSDLSPGEERECPLWVHGPEAPVQATTIYRNGPGPAYRIKTSQGYEIIGTPAHRVYALEKGSVDWALLEDLQLGHTLCIDRRPGMFSETPFTRPTVSKSAFMQDRADYDTRTNIPTELTLQVASLLGYIVSEGHVRRNLIALGTSDPNQMVLYERSLSGLIDHTTEAEDTRRDTPFDERRFHRVADIAALRGFGLTLGLAHEKEIPAGVLQSPKPVVQAFLRALFDGDGGVESHNTVAYCTVSEKLARQLHTLLLSFGVLARRKMRPTSSDHGESWHLYITGDALRTFTSEIGFNLEHKQAAAEAICERPSNTNIDVVPDIAELCADVVAAYKTTRGTTHSTHPSYGAFKDYRKGRRRPSHEGLRRLLDTYELRGHSSWEKLNALQGSWFFDPIVEIEAIEADTYDFVVPEGHAFTGGGLINHNTYALTAAVKHYTEEEGIPPERILVTTFTKAATTEMSERIRELGVRGAEVGTTHSISARIIRDYEPSLNYAMKGAHDGRSAKLFRMAMKQVEMSPASGGRYAEDRQAGKTPRTRYYDVPANQWFNLGTPLVETTVGRCGKTKTRKIGAKRLQLISDNWATKGTDPATAWGQHRDDPGTVMFFAAAVYGAYEWLKGNDPQFSPCMDFVDWLKAAVNIVENNETARTALQDWFRVVIVDEAQDLNCVGGDTEVQTPHGPAKVRDLQVGNHIQAFENGKVVFRRVSVKERSAWDRGVRITTTSGRTLTMSPNHRIYASPPTVPEDQMALYLMYRSDLGFRIGTSNKPITFRGSSEHAECLWVLDIGDPAEMLYQEQAFSLRFGVPTYIFEGTVRGCDQPRIDRIFGEFGENGRALLDRFDLDFRYPHWTAASMSRGRFERRTVRLCAHRGDTPGKRQPRGTSINMNWTGDLNVDPGVPIYDTKGGRKMINVLSTDYTEAREIALALAERTGARLEETLLLADTKLPLITASALFPGMKVPVNHGATDLEEYLSIESYKQVAERLGVSLDGVGGSHNTGKHEIHVFLYNQQVQAGVADCLPRVRGSNLMLEDIESVEIVDGGDYWDLTVESCQNFFGNGVLSHNTLQWALFDTIGENSLTYAVIGDDKQAIYEWRGADPDEFQDKRDQGFSTKLLTTNYRSGGAIVEAGNRLMLHNEDRQIPMVCKAKPSKEDMGRLVCVQPDTHQAGAKATAAEIYDALKGGLGLNPDDFGVIVRNNAEAEAFALSLASRGIPFRGKNVGKFFNKPHVKGLTAWVRIATETDTRKLDAAINEGSKFPAFGLGPRFLDQLAVRARQGRRSYYDVLVDDVLKGGIRLYGSAAYDARVESLAEQIVSIRETYGGGDGSDVLTVLRQGLNVKGIDKTLREYIIDQLGPEDLDADDYAGVEPSEDEIELAVDAMIRPLLDLANVSRFNLDPGKYLGFLDQMRGQSNQQKTKGKDEDRKPAVRIDTCHQWKGLEARHVYVCMSGGVFPFYGDQLAFDEGDLEALDSERRLAYVAITRGKESVTVLCPKKNYRNKDAGISQFVLEACIPLEGEEDGTEGGTPKTAFMKYNDDEDDPVSYMEPQTDTDDESLMELP